MLVKEAYKDFARKVANVVNGPGNNPAYIQFASEVREHMHYRHVMDMTRDKQHKQ